MRTALNIFSRSGHFNFPAASVRRTTAFQVYSQAMKDPEKWRDLCAQAAAEQDPKKLMELVREITRLLDEKQCRLTKVSEDGAQSTRTAV